MKKDDRTYADMFLDEMGAGAGPDPEELNGVRAFVSSLLAALKNYSLLPEEHATTRRMVSQVYRGLVAFLRDYGSLRLDIGKETMHYRGEEVYRGPATSDNLAYICCRDGIVWLEFQEGIETWELTGFFRIINRYRVLPEEPEDDLVTAMWAEAFPHIQYEANDDLWEAEPVLEFSMINPAGLRQIYEKSSGAGVLGGVFSLDGGAGPGPGGGDAAGDGTGDAGPGAGGGDGPGPGAGPASGGVAGEGGGGPGGPGPGGDVHGEGDGPGGAAPPGGAIHITGARDRMGDGVEPAADDAPPDYHGHIAVSIASPGINHDLWTLSEEERKYIARLVEKEEARVIGNDVVEMLMTVLIRETDPRIFESILNFMLEEFRSLLEMRDFSFAYALLGTIGRIRDHATGKREWTRPLLDKYFNDISEPEILDALMPVWPDLASLGPENLQKFAAIMQFLPGRAGASFGPMINSVRDPAARRLFLDIIATFARRDVGTLVTLLERPEEDLVAKLLHGLDPDRDRAAEGVLADKLLHHPRPAIRKKALAILVDWQYREYRKLMPLLDDQDPEIRAAVLEYFGRRRSDGTEDLLQDYLGRERYRIDDPEHIKACYRVLGQCGSVRSIPFLERILTGQRFNFVMGTGAPAHRHGAALALAGIDTPECLAILRKAERSSMPHIRAAAQKALAARRKR